MVVNTIEDTDPKRVDYSARTVIGADPTLKLNQLGIPHEVAQIHTKPETVTEFNIKWLTELVNTGKANFYTTTKKKRDEDTGEEIEVKKKTNLRYGSVVKGTDLIHGDLIVRGNIELKKDKKGKLIIPEDCEGIIEVKTGKELLKRGDKLVRDGKYVEDLKYPEKKLVTLKIGDVVDRQLQKGDIVLLNRQPCYF